MSRLRTNRHWKVEQYSAEAESAICLRWNRFKTLRNEDEILGNKYLLRILVFGSLTVVGKATWDGIKGFDNWFAELFILRVNSGMRSTAHNPPGVIRVTNLDNMVRS